MRNHAREQSKAARSAQDRAPVRRPNRLAVPGIHLRDVFVPRDRAHPRPRHSVPDGVRAGTVLVVLDKNLSVDQIERNALLAPGDGTKCAFERRDLLRAVHSVYFECHRIHSKAIIAERVRNA